MASDLCRDGEGRNARAHSRGLRAVAGADASIRAASLSSICDDRYGSFALFPRCLPDDRFDPPKRTWPDQLVMSQKCQRQTIRGACLLNGYLARASGTATSRAQSTKSWATGLNTRFRNVNTATGCCQDGSSTGSTLSERRSPL